MFEEPYCCVSPPAPEPRPPPRAPEVAVEPTVAPTDEAFAALPEELLDELVTAPEGTLTDILRYHVGPGVVMAEDVITLDEATTDLGQPVMITIDDDGNVFLNNTVQIIATNIMASNGVVHVIDAVLVPGS